MPTSSPKQRLGSRWWVTALAALIVLGCCRARTCARPVPASVPLPPPPPLGLGPATASEIPLALAPSGAPRAGGRISGYGPADHLSVAPSGSAGTSTDIRHAQSRGPSLVPVPSDSAPS